MSLLVGLEDVVLHVPGFRETVSVVGLAPIRLRLPFWRISINFQWNSG